MPHVLPEQPPVRVAVLDDSELVLCGMAAMLAPYADRVRLVPTGTGGTTCPPCDLALYDPAYALLRRSGSAAPARTCRGVMVAFSWDCSRSAVSTELARGAGGYLGKRLPAERLVRDLVHIRAGRVVVDVGTPEHQGEGAKDWPLTDRETLVLGLIASGRSNREIAEGIGVSINSIKSYIRAAYGKIGVTSRSQAVLWGVQHGLLLQPADDRLRSAGPRVPAG